MEIYSRGCWCKVGVDLVDLDQSSHSASFSVGKKDLLSRVMKKATPNTCFPCNCC